MYEGLGYQGVQRVAWPQPVEAPGSCWDFEASTVLCQEPAA